MFEAFKLALELSVLHGILSTPVYKGAAKVTVKWLNQYHGRRTSRCLLVMLFIPPTVVLFSLLLCELYAELIPWMRRTCWVCLSDRM